jgi:hypothetical protein
MADATEKILEWAQADARVDVNDDGTLTLRGEPPIQVTFTADDERVVLAHTHELPGAGAAKADAAVRALGGRRGTLVEGSAKVTTDGVSVTLESPIFLDGLSRDSFARALQDLAAETDAVIAAVADGTDAAPADPETAEPAGSTEIDEEAEDTDTPETDADETREVERATAWSPTHAVPSGGMSAWARPDPSLEPSAQLQARVQLAIAERRGDWARVVGANGWSGWVDARRLEPAGTAAAPAPSGGPKKAPSTIDFDGFSISALPLLGGAVLIVVSFLPWFDTAFGSENAFGIPVAFLADFDTQDGSPYLGWFLIALGAGAIVVSAMPKVPSVVTRIIGLVAILAALAFIGQSIRGVTDAGFDASETFTDFLGFAPYVAIAGGAVLLAARK